MRTIGGGIYAFDEEGVVVSIPPEMSNVTPRRLDLEWSRDMYLPDNFRHLRLVLNLKLVDSYNPEEYQLKFSSPVEIQVYYRWAERILAKNQGVNLSLAYWQNDQWNLIEKYVDVFPILSRGWAGFLRFEVENWGDPTIALGF
jgi:hypothetical protein